MPVKILDTLDDVMSRETYLNQPVDWEIAGSQMGALVADVHALGAATEATRKILTQARNERFPAAKVNVVPLHEPTPPVDSKDLITVLGEIPTVAEELDQDEAEELFPAPVYDQYRHFPPKRNLGPIEAFDPPTAAEVPDGITEVFGHDGGSAIYVGAIPILSKLLAKFKKRSEPTYVRLDTPKTYKDFRGAQSRSMAELQNRVAELGRILRAHAADGHGGVEIIGDGYLEVATDIAGDISDLFSQIAEKRVPLRLPPFADGKWDCWRENGPNGGIVCCSIMLPGPDGDLRIATSATPVGDHVVEVCDYVRGTDSTVTELLGVLPTISCMLGGSHLIPRMAKAAPKLLARPEVQSGDSIFVGKIVPDTNPNLAALMTLCQRAQAGDPQAIREWKLLAKCAEKQILGAAIVASPTITYEIVNPDLVTVYWMHDPKSNPKSASLVTQQFTTPGDIKFTGISSHVYHHNNEVWYETLTHWLTLIDFKSIKDRRIIKIAVKGGVTNNRKPTSAEIEQWKGVSTPKSPSVVTTLMKKARDLLQGGQSNKAA